MRKPSIGPAAVTTGISEFRSTCSADDPPPAQPLRARRADVVLLERLEHRAADEPGEVRHRPEPERDRRAGSCSARSSSRSSAGRMSPPQREEVDQQRRDQEARDGEADVREEHRRVVEPRVLPQRGDHSQRDADDDREAGRRGPELERRREMVADDVVDVSVAQHERRPEVEREDALDVVQRTACTRVVEAVLLVEVPLDRPGSRAPTCGTGSPRSAASSRTS